MTHQFLSHLHRSSGLVQPRTVCVAERVPADFPSFPASVLRVSRMRIRLPFAVG
jgi:hypothetical protein